MNMNNLSTNSSNKRFFKVQEELKRLLSVIMYQTEEDSQENGFDSIIANSQNPEDIKIAEYLKKDSINREERIKRDAIVGSNIIRNKTENKSIDKNNNPTIKVQAKQQLNNDKDIKKKEIDDKDFDIEH